MNQEAEKAAFELLKSKPAQWVIVGGVAIYLLPRAMSYLVDHIEQGTSYLLGAAWKGVTGKVDDAEASIEASGRYYRRKFDDAFGRKSDEEKYKDLHPDYTSVEVYDGPDIESYRKEMRIPPSAEFFMFPQDNEGSRNYLRTNAWDYYGLRTIGEQVYALLLPSTIILYIVEDEVQTEDADEKGFCPSGWKRVNIDNREMCTRIVEKEVLVPPVIRGGWANTMKIWDQFK